MDFHAKNAHEKGSDVRHAQEARENPWPHPATAQCEHCIAYREYPAGKCCAVQAQKNGTPYLVKDMETCPGIPTPPVNEESGL